MPVEQTTAVNITCDNPACPGNSLDSTDRAGWTFVSTEVYGHPTSQSVYCSSSCASAITLKLDEEEEARNSAQGGEAA